jgi:hypothetical protein
MIRSTFGEAALARIQAMTAKSLSRNYLCI